MTKLFCCFVGTGQCCRQVQGDIWWWLLRNNYTVTMRLWWLHYRWHLRPTTSTADLLTHEW